MKQLNYYQDMTHKDLMALIDDYASVFRFCSDAAVAKDRAALSAALEAVVQDAEMLGGPVGEVLSEHLPEGTTHISVGGCYNGSGATHELRVYAFKYQDGELVCYGTDNEGEYGAWSLARLVFREVPVVTPLYSLETPE